LDDSDFDKKISRMLLRVFHRLTIVVARRERERKTGGWARAANGHHSVGGGGRE
jgi:hypothetical protein